jgi:Colicin V production protein
MSDLTCNILVSKGVTRPRTPRSLTTVILMDTSDLLFHDMPFNAIDVLLVVLVLLSILNGWRRGFIHGVLDLAGWVLSLVAGLVTTNPSGIGSAGTLMCGRKCGTNQLRLCLLRSLSVSLFI